MSNFDTHIICPKCSYPVPMVGPDETLNKECPLCGYDLEDDIRRKQELIEDLRVSVFLRQFFDEPRLIEPDELLDFLGINSKKTLRKLIEQGELEYVDVGAGEEKRIMRFRPVQILEFLERRSNSE